METKHKSQAIPLLIAGVIIVGAGYGIFKAANEYEMAATMEISWGAPGAAKHKKSLHLGKTPAPQQGAQEKTQAH